MAARFGSSSAVNGRRENSLRSEGLASAMFLGDLHGGVLEETFERCFVWVSGRVAGQGSHGSVCRNHTVPVAGSPVLLGWSDLIS